MNKHNINSGGKFLFMSAPMEDITDSVYRNLAHKYGADLTFTEMTRIESLARNNNSTLEKTRIPDLTPTQIQLIGSSEPALKKYLSNFNPEGGFRGFNLNMGCPAPQIVNQGYGCAMVKRISKVKKMLALVKDAGHPCSIKMRLGLNAYEKERKVYLNLIDAADADFFVVHTRHGGQQYSTPPDHSVIHECTKFGKPIIINGDISLPQHIELVKSQGASGVMIGRAAIRDYAIFDRLKGKDAPSTEQLSSEYRTLAEQVNSRFKYRENVLKWLGTQGKTKEEFKE